MEELFLRVGPPDAETGVAAPESSLGEVGGEATFCWSIVDVARAAVLGLREDEVVLVLPVVVVAADVVVVVVFGKVAALPSLGLALGLAVAEAVAVAVAEDRRLPLFLLPLPDEDWSKFSPWPRPVGLPAYPEAVLVAVERRM